MSRDVQFCEENFSNLNEGRNEESQKPSTRSQDPTTQMIIERHIVTTENNNQEPRDDEDSLSFLSLSEANENASEVGENHEVQVPEEDDEAQHHDEVSDMNVLADNADDVLNEVETLPEIVPRRSSRVPKPRMLFAVETLENDEPSTLKEALKSPNSDNWKIAMKNEVDSFFENKTCVAAKLPEGKKAIKTKWVFKLKNEADGSVRFKARLVVKGYTQTKGIDYNETYSPVVRYPSIRYLIALSAKFNLEFHQMDAITVFLQGDLDEEIYVAIYVDDILICTNDMEAFERLRQELMKRFKMKYLGEAKTILGLKITRDRKAGKIYLDQEAYIDKMLRRFNMDNCKSVSTPFDSNQKLLKLTEGEVIEDNEVPYQEAIGCLLYAAQGCRPDISYAVNCLSKFNNKHSQTHWGAVKRVFRYLQGTKKIKLCYSRDGASEIQAYSDADWANDPNDRRSVTGYLLMMQGGPISWSSKRQQTIALSTTEAEYMAVSATTQEVMWMKGLNSELQPKTKSDPVIIYCGNQSAIHLGMTNSYHPRTKHIDVGHHFIREKIEEKNIILKYKNTLQMVADIYTKPLPKPKFEELRDLMGLTNI